jgi:Domain of unknown function (DUF4190)
VNCTQCGSPAEPGQTCPSCGTLQPLAASGTSPAWGQTPPPPGGGQPADPGSSYPTYGSPASAPPPPGLPSYGAPAAGSGFGAPTGPPPGPGYGQYQAYQPTATAFPSGSKTNGFAIASLICSIAFCFGITPILGIIFGFVARGQIKRSGGAEGGNGLAIAGIIIGFFFVLLWLLYVLLIVIIGVTASTTNNGSLGLLGGFGTLV